MVATTEDRYLAPDSEAARLYARAKQVMPGGNTRTTVYQKPYPPYATRGVGQRIYDADGSERIDFINNYTALIHGHADPDINAAVIEQLQFGTAFALPTEQEVGLAEMLCARIPSLERVRFTNSGSEAVMLAVKGARAYTGRPKIMKFEGCYHGSYDYVEVSLASTAATWGDGDPASVPYSYGAPEGMLNDVIVSHYNDVATTERLIEQHRHELAAVLVDPMPMRAGMAMGSAPFLGRIRELTQQYGIVLIFDEVISLRLGYGGAQADLGITPDMTTMAKIIGGGFPVGAFGGSAEVMSVFDPSQGYPKAPHGGTFNANPITMTAGRVAMEKLTPAAFARMNELGTALREGLAEAMDAARQPGQVTGGGSLFSIHMHDRPIVDYRSSLATPEETAKMTEVHQGLLSRGIFCAPTLAGTLSTPMDEADVNAFVSAFAESLGVG